MNHTWKKDLGIEFKGKIVYIKKPFPLMGHIAFGIIDRGYNLVQVRVSSLCNLACIFCSVNAGKKSPRIKEFMLKDAEWLEAWLRKIVSIKGEIHVLFDAAGEPLTNPLLPEFIKTVHEVPRVKSIILETRLYPPNKNIVEKLVKAGLNRVNVSIDTLNPDLARILTGTKEYDLNKIIELIKHIHYETPIHVHLTPLWIPGINDEDIEQIIMWIKENRLSKGFPPLGIQKYVIHKHGRKIPGIREWSWRKFYQELRRLEEKYELKLVLTPRDYELKKAPRINPPYKKGDNIKAVVYTEGLLRNEFLATSYKKDWVITIISKKQWFELGDIVNIKIIHDKDGVLLARVH